VEVKVKSKEFLMNMAKGAGIGVAVIIPGVSGGTLAVLMNVYDKMIDSIGNLRKDFKNSFMFLLPIIFGAIIALAAAYFPIKYALKYAPLPTVLLFVGLMVGSCPKTIKDAGKNGFRNKTDILAIVLPFLFVIGICFIPGINDVNLGEDMNGIQYFLIILIGIIGSCALVVPGVSGSMLLLLLGYYNPIFSLVSDLKVSPLHSIVMLLLFAVGVVIGFFTIAKLMQFLLKRFPRTTYWAIVGFVVGSIPAILISFDYGSSPIDGVQIGVGVALCVFGAVATYFMTYFAEKRIKLTEKGDGVDGDS
jgi:putative membrane protein